MSNVITHVFNTHNVRTVDVDGTPMFVAADVAKALGYSNTSDAIGKHCKKVSRNAIASVSSQQVSLIPESDVYRLVMRSKLESAEQFQDWVMETVLPSLRKDGGYVVQQESMDPLERISATLAFAKGVIEKQQQQIRDRALRGVMVTPKKLVAEYCVRAKCDKVGGTKGALYINQRLENAGLQVRGRNARGQNVYTPTEKGQMYAKAVSATGLHWDLAVVDILLEDK